MMLQQKIQQELCTTTCRL